MSSKMAYDKEDLKSVPGIGPRMAEDLQSLGVSRVSDLKGKDPELLYETLAARTGGRLDRCVLYTFKCAVYYASNESHDPEKLKWWNWKQSDKD